MNFKHICLINFNCDSCRTISLFKKISKKNKIKLIYIKPEGLNKLMLNNFKNVFILNEKINKENLEVFSKFKLFQPFSNLIWIKEYFDKKDLEKILNHKIDFFIKTTDLTINILNKFISNLIDKEIETINNNFVFSKEIKINLINHTVFKNDIQIFLTNVEFKLLKFLMENKNKFCSISEILEKIWGYKNDFDNTRIIKQHVFNIKSKIGKNYIISKHNFGYGFIDK